MINGVDKLWSDEIDAIIHNRFTGSVMVVGEHFKQIAEYIHYRTPTAYGRIEFDKTSRPLVTLDKESRQAIANRIAVKQGDDNHNITSLHRIEDFVRKGERLVKMLHGGSAGKILLVEDEGAGKLFIRKTAARAGVEGNGIPKAHAELKFLIALREDERFANLLVLYPALRDFRVEDTSIFFDQEYIGDGRNVFTMLADETLPAEKHLEYLQAFLSTIIRHGYLLDKRLVSDKESFEQLEDYYLRRAEGRARFLLKCNSFAMDFTAGKMRALPDLIHRETIHINNIPHRNPLSIINEIRLRKDLMEIFRPRMEGFCAHGDLTLLNMVFDPHSESYKLIDNRGHLGNWDPLYDIAKLKLTLSGLGQIMNEQMHVSEDSSGNFNVEFVHEKERENVPLNLNASFLDDLSKNKDFLEMVRMEPYWRERILFAEATHFLSDTPHRLLVDQSAKNATLVFLMGTQYLNSIYEAVIS